MDMTSTRRCSAVFRRLNHFLSLTQQPCLDAVMGDKFSERFREIAWRSTGDFFVRCSSVTKSWEHVSFESHDDQPLILHTHTLVIENEERRPPICCYAEVEVHLECYNDYMLEFLHDGLRYVKLPGDAGVAAVTEEARVVPFRRVLQRLGRELRSLETFYYTLTDGDDVTDALLQFSLKHDLARFEAKPKVTILFLSNAELQQFWLANLAVLTDARLHFLVILFVVPEMCTPDSDAVVDQFEHLLIPHFTPTPPHSSFDICITSGVNSLFYSKNRDSHHQNVCRVREDDAAELWSNGDVEFSPERKYRCNILNQHIFACISTNNVRRYETLEIQNWNSRTVELIHADLKCLTIHSTDAISTEDFCRAMQKLSTNVQFVKFECSSLLDVDVGQVLLDFAIAHKLRQRGLKPKFSVSSNKQSVALQFLQQNLAAFADPRQQFIVEIAGQYYYEDTGWRSSVEMLLQPLFRLVSLRNEKGRIWNVVYDVLVEIFSDQLAFVQR